MLVAKFGTAWSENRIEVCLGQFDVKHKDNQLALHHRLWNTSEVLPISCTHPKLKQLSKAYYTVKVRLPDENKLPVGDSAIIFAYQLIIGNATSCSGLV